MRNLLAFASVSLLAACGPSVRVDNFELGTSCDVGQPIEECTDFAPVPDVPGDYARQSEQPALVLGLPAIDVRVRVKDGLVTRIYAEFAQDVCQAVRVQLHNALGPENRQDLSLSHWRGTAYGVDYSNSVDRPVCGVSIEERSTTNPFASE